MLQYKYYGVLFCHILTYLLHSYLDNNNHEIYVGLLLHPHLGMQSIVIIVSFCLSVCLSTRISQKPHFQISPNFMYMLCMAMDWSSSECNAIHYIMYFQFCGWHHFFT